MAAGGFLMAVSKRLRFEVLRRDNHACRYCGAGAPEVKLTVDHVIPTALGGGDDPENLVTACAGCNSGKSSINPDEPLIADVKSDALRWSRAMEEATELQRMRQRDLRVFQEGFEVAWDDAFTRDYWIDEDRMWRLDSEPDRSYPVAVVRFEDDVAVKPFDSYAEARSWLREHVGYPGLPADWRTSVETWFSAGVAVGDVAPLMLTVAKKSNVYKSHKWRYFCGCVWTLVRQRQEIAQSLLMKQEADD